MDVGLPVVDITLERGGAGLGFNIKGGIDAPHVPGETGIFVTKVREDGAAFKDGRLKEGDRILEINKKNIEHVTHNEAVQLFVNSGNRVQMKVQHGAERILRERLARNPGMSKSGGDDDKSVYWKAGLVGLSVSLALFLVYRFYRKGSVFPR
ncbi:synaptojanin-2-binding protein-like [Liolophura sinensis]|uniref:synaptojanin-2-binding protein-like n=1 Tax=Liolophura sinensis TaxID=3198878 RepID=UPI003158191A